MTKLQHPILIAKEKFEDYHSKIFFTTDLGKIHQVIPFEKLSILLPQRNSEVGAPSWLSREGFLALMFLKSYMGLSDEKLIERLNTDWAIQYFCGIQLKDNERISDKNLVSRIRVFVGKHLDIEKFQQILAQHWKDDIENKYCALNDATAYESYIKFPSDVKLLWDCCQFVFASLKSICKILKIKQPRSKYKDQCEKQLSYQKSKKKTWKQTQKRKKALLYLLNKGLEQLKTVLEEYSTQMFDILDNKFAEHLKIIIQVYEQQLYMFENNENAVANRIVSLFKPYLRPIVRGKETKRVEFGAKVMITQVDGIDWIDKLSFDAYNESVYLKASIIKHKERFGQCNQIGVDQIYGTNANRSWMKENGIYHSLRPKGKASKNEEQYKKLRKELGKQRATALEGTFGNQKNHYGLNKIKARTQATEIVWIFFLTLTEKSKNPL